jgi:hypothetical protein
MRSTTLCKTLFTGCVKLVFWVYVTCGCAYKFYSAFLQYFGAPRVFQFSYPAGTTGFCAVLSTLKTIAHHRYVQVIHVMHSTYNYNNYLYINTQKVGEKI